MADVECKHISAPGRYSISRVKKAKERERESVREKKKEKKRDLVHLRNSRRSLLGVGTSRESSRGIFSRRLREKGFLRVRFDGTLQFPPFVSDKTTVE